MLITRIHYTITPYNFTGRECGSVTDKETYDILRKRVQNIKCGMTQFCKFKIYCTLNKPHVLTCIGRTTKLKKKKKVLSCILRFSTIKTFFHNQKQLYFQFGRNCYVGKTWKCNCYDHNAKLHGGKQQINIVGGKSQFGSFVVVRLHACFPMFIKQMDKNSIFLTYKTAGISK